MRRRARRNDAVSVAVTCSRRVGSHGWVIVFPRIHCSVRHGNGGKAVKLRIRVCRSFRVLLLYFIHYLLYSLFSRKRLGLLSTWTCGYCWHDVVSNMKIHCFFFLFFVINVKIHYSSFLKQFIINPSFYVRFVSDRWFFMLDCWLNNTPSVSGGTRIESYERWTISLSTFS